MASTPPVTVAEFKKRFARDFQYGTGSDKVTDDDISMAMSDALTMFNPSLFSTADGKTAFLMVTAHFVVSNVQAAGGPNAGPGQGQGLNNAPEEIQTSASVGGLNNSFLAPPDRVANNPTLRQFWSTSYGRRYIGLVMPKIIGAVTAIAGPSEVDTRPGSSPTVPFAEGS